MVESLATMCEALGSILRTEGRGRKGKEREPNPAVGSDSNLKLEHKLNS